MKKKIMYSTILLFFVLTPFSMYGHCRFESYCYLYCTDENNLVGTVWLYEDGNGKGFCFYFVSDNWVKAYAFEKNEKRQGEWDNYYVLVEEELYKYKMDSSSNNSGTMWKVDGTWEECQGSFAISGDMMGFTNKKQTMSWTLKKTYSIPDCIKL